MSREPVSATSSPLCVNFAMSITDQTFSDRYEHYVVDAVRNNFPQIQL